MDGVADLLAVKVEVRVGASRAQVDVEHEEVLRRIERPELIPVPIEP